MQHVQRLEDLSVNKPSTVTIGVFDGVHRGHQHLIRALVEQAHGQDHLAGVMTFHPHPDEVLRGPKGRYYLTTVEERAELLAALGVDYLVTHPFNHDVIETRAADFVDRLVAYMNLTGLWVGEDFALGYKREGDVAFLKQQGDAKGFSVQPVALVDTESDIVSSTTIRRALLDADLVTAQQLLGRSYHVSGEIIHGQKRGRQIGFPTANIEVPGTKLIPATGVYACWAYLGDERHMAATNIGYNPTFGNDAISVEAHLLDFNRDIYGQHLTLQFETHLRPEQKFDGLDALVAQLGTDVGKARDILAAQQVS
ncbi:MAG: bifunctional riboflavin kinase/FAD synthetase [Chloroflexota bacterium]